MIQDQNTSRGIFPGIAQPKTRSTAQWMAAGLLFLLTFSCRTLIAQGTVTVNFASAVNSSGTPLIFGASNEPNPADQATVYPMFWSSGLKFERGTIHIDQVVPSNTTITAYTAAMPNGVGSYTAGSVADPSTWNWGPLSWATYAKAQGMTTMANLLFVPQWLSYNDSNVSTAPANNWDSLGIVWEDIVTKVVKQELTACNGGPCLNYMEILNEPTCGFLNVGSGDTSWSSEAQAADYYYFYASTPAHAADPALILGGDADCNHGTSSFGDMPTLIADQTLKAEGLLNFVSYHDYTPDEAGDNVSEVSTMLSNNGYSGLPIFLTEWNYTGANGTTDPHVVGDQAATYIGDNLIFFSEHCNRQNGRRRQPLDRCELPPLATCKKSPSLHSSYTNLGGCSPIHQWID